MDQIGMGAPLAGAEARVLVDVQRWLNDRGWSLAYGVNSARAERGDLILFDTTQRDLSLRERLDAA